MIHLFQKDSRDEEGMLLLFINSHGFSMLETITFILYFLAALLEGFQLSTRLTRKYHFIFYLGIPAVLLHAYLLYTWVYLAAGQNLTEFNLFSLATWTTSCLVLLLSIAKPFNYLSLFIFPLAASSMILVSQFPSSHIVQAINPFRQYMHIILAVVTFSVLSIAGIQAITLAAQERFIKQKNLDCAAALPPLETMEKFLFQVIALGCFLLSCILGTSLYFFHPILLPSFFEKTILTFITWLVFTLLLIGRHFGGWRGKKAIYWTLSGVTLLSIIYFGSMLILRLLL